MTVYADVLILLNMIVDYLILSLTSHILNMYIKTIRIVIASFLGALFSLMIFLPDYGLFLDLCIMLISASVITLSAFGFKSIRNYIKVFFAYFTVNVVYNGLMTAVWTIFKPSGMVINNSVTYFDISPFDFIIFSLIFYLIIRLAQSIIKRTSPFAKRCRIRLENQGRTLEVSALVDTGNSLCDPFTGKQVIIMDRDTAGLIIEDLENSPRFLLPISSVNSDGIIPAYFCKKAVVENKRELSVLIAVTDKEFDSDYKAIVNPSILN